MKSKIVLALAILVALVMLVPAFGQTASMGATLKFTAPTAHTDGSPITGALTYSAYYGAKGSTTKTRYGTAIKPDGSVTIPGMTPGTCFVVTATEANIESGPSNEACLPFPPNSATGLSVTVTIQITTP